MAGLLAGTAPLAQADLAEINVKVAYAKGDVTDGAGRALKTGDHVRAGDSVRTGADGVVDLAWVNEGAGSSIGKALTRSVIRLERASELKIDKLVQYDFGSGSGMNPYIVAKMDLKEGSMFANIKKSSGGKFEVKTVNSVAGIRGTAFKLSKSGTIIVTEGSVVNKLILPNGTTVRVTIEQGQKLLVTTRLLAALVEHPDLATELSNIMLERPGVSIPTDVLDGFYREMRGVVDSLQDSAGKATSETTVDGMSIIYGDVPRVMTDDEVRSGLTPSEKKKKKRQQPPPPSPSPPSTGGSPPSPSR